MTALLLLIIIYFSFISLGLPDSLLGSAWPLMYGSLNVPLHYAGFVSTIAAGGTVVSSVLSERMKNRRACPAGIFIMILTLEILNRKIDNKLVR